MTSGWAKLLRAYAAPILGVLLLAVVSFWAPSVVRPDNILQVLRQVAVPGLMAIGVTFVVVTGRLDLSVGSLLSLCVVMVITLHERFGPGIAIAAVVLIGLASGCVSGFLVAYLRLNSLIATLAMLSILQGLTWVLAGGISPRILHPNDTWFRFFGRGYVFGLAAPIWILAISGVVFAVVLHKTLYGRTVMAVGGGEEASVFSTLDNKRTVLIAYLISAALTAVAAIVLASRVMSGQNDTGSGYELLVLSGIILGGTSLLGGSGSIWRSLLGVVLLGFLANALVMLGAPYYMQWIITGIVIMVAVWIELATKRGRLLA